MSSTEIFQAIVDALILGSLSGMMGGGFGLILGVTGRFHFAFATTFVCAAYVAVALVEAGTPLYAGIVAGVICATLAGIAMEWWLYRPLVRKTSHALLGVFVTALGIVIVGENIIQLLASSADQNLGVGYAVTRISFGDGVGITTLDLVTFAVSVVIVLALWGFIRFARYGRAIRAVQENPAMAQAVGINPHLAYVVVFAIGSALSGVGAILLTQRGTLSPGSGVEPTLTALVIAFLAGLGSSPIRFALTGVLVALLQQFCLIAIGAVWTPVLTFGILFVYIAVSPMLTGGRPRLRLRPVASRPAAEKA